MHITRGLKAAGKENGQIAVLFALLFPVLILFTGFAIDFGFGFLARAELAKGCDGANLEAMLNYGLGTTQAAAIGQSVFALNYKANPLFGSSPPTAIFTFGRDAGGNPICDCAATASIRTSFIRIMGIPTLNVSNFSEATRPPVILSMVLDRTGSMLTDGGAAAMPGAVADFDKYFIEGTDQLGETSFAWDATNDVPIAKTFVSNINNSVTNLSFKYGTYSMSGLQSGLNQVTSVANPPVNAVKVVVFFTDGWDNTIQAYLPNPTAANKVLVEFGGNAATTGGFNEGNGFALVDPNNVGDNSGNGFYGGGTTSNPTTTMTCRNGDGSGSWPTYTSPNHSTNISYCNGANTFIPIGGSTDPLGTSAVPINRINITTDAEYTTYQLAETMRAQGITVYAIGLASSSGGIDKTYLQEIANDPASDKYNASEAQGLALIAPNATDLNTAFQTVAAKILLRLTQ